MTGEPGVGEPCVGSLVVGPAGHGAVEVAIKTAAGTLVRAETLDDLDVSKLSGSAVVHVHFTDRLFGDRCEESAARFCQLVAPLGRPVVVTLHDLPMASQGAELHRRRSAAYRSVTESVAAVIVSSRHEARLLEATGATPATLRVVPLPIDRRAGPVATARLEPRPEAGVLGWIYPGKGHADVLEALPPGVSLLALGAASPGHDDLLAQLKRNPSFHSTGFLSADDLDLGLRQVAVPVAPSSSISASASIGRWLEAGRRPLVIDGPWVRELDARCPGSVTVVTVEKLGEAIAAAIAFPETTWLGDTVVGPTSAEVARAIRDICLEAAG